MDLIPKFLMANGQLVKLLVHTGESFASQEIFVLSDFQGLNLQKVPILAKLTFSVLVGAR